MSRKFLTSLALILFLNLLIKPLFAFFIDPTVQNIVGPKQYGFYFSVLSFTWILNIILDLGITNFNNRDIARHHQLLNKYFSNILGIKIILGLFYIAFGIGAAIIWGYSYEKMKMLLILLLNMFLISFILYLRSNISGLQLFKTDSIVSVLDRTILIVICVILIWGEFAGDFTIYHYVYAQTVSYLLTFIIAFLIVFAKAGKVTINFNLKYFIALLKQSLPYALLIFLMSSYKFLDGVLLEKLAGDFQTGIYAQSFRLLDGISQFAFLFAVLLLPMFSKMIKQNQPIKELTLISSLLLIVPAITLAICVVFFKHEIISLFYQKDVQNSSTVLGLLMISFVSISAGYIFGTLLTANGNLKVLNALAGAAVIINITLNFLLIPKFKAVGSAYASLATQSFMAITQFIFAAKIFRFKFNSILFTRLTLYSLFIVFINYILKDFSVEWYLKFIFNVFISLSLAVIIKLINVRFLIDLLKTGSGKS